MANIRIIKGLLTINSLGEYIDNMFSLNVERGKFLVIRDNNSADELMDIYKMPIDGDLYEGKIIEVLPVSGYCYALVGDNYEKIAARYGCSLKKLIELNKNSIIYPTKRIWLP
ncbi:MAG: LysM peptidoglycan-binding domain-containing protein [Candidatus Coproplasma sp.]